LESKTTLRVPEAYVPLLEDIRLLTADQNNPNRTTVKQQEQIWRSLQKYRVTRLVVLPDYQGLGAGKRLLNFIAELYTSQTRIPFYTLTSNPQIIR
jgi:GNAT superfamily N-acetyltransferase